MARTPASSSRAATTTRSTASASTSRALTDKLGARRPDERLPEDLHGVRAAVRADRSGVAGRVLPHGGRGRGRRRCGRWTTVATHGRAVLHRRRRPTRSACCWRQAATGQVTVLRGYEGTTARRLAGWRAHEEALAQERVRLRRGVAREPSRTSRSPATPASRWAARRRGSRSRTRGASTPAIGRTTSTRRGWPSQWWSGGHAKRTAPANGGDVRKVALSYSQTAQHDLYLGTFLYTDCGKVRVVGGRRGDDHDLYSNEYGGTVANLKVARQRARRETTPSRSPLCSTRTPPAPGTTSTSITSGRLSRRTFRTRRRSTRTSRSPSTSTPTTATRSLRPGTSGNSRSSGSRATPTCTWASSGTTSGSGSARPIRTPRSRSPARRLRATWCRSRLAGPPSAHAIGYGETLQ